MSLHAVPTENGRRKRFAHILSRHHVLFADELSPRLGKNRWMLRKKHSMYAVAVAMGCLLGCSDDSKGSSKSPGGLDGGLFGTGNCESKLPFGGDVCQSLKDGDFTQFNVSVASTMVLGGFGGSDQPNTQCVYNVKDATDNTAQPGVSFASPCTWDSFQKQESKSADDMYMTVGGLGDAAFSFFSFGDLVIFVKYKGYVVIVSQGGFTPHDANGMPIDEATVMTKLAQTVLGRL